MPNRYRTSILTAFILYIIMAAAPAVQAQSWLWGRKAAGPNLDLITDIGLDRNGNSYVVGTFERSITFDFTLDNGARTGLFIAKYNPAGVLQWVVEGTGSGDFVEPSIAVEKSGNSYVAGGFSGSASIGLRSITSIGSSDAFLVRIDSAGVVQWVRRGGGTLADAATGVAIDSIVGDCLVTGTFNGTAKFDTMEVVSVGKADVFLTKFNALGDTRWLVSKGSPEDDLVRAIGTSQAGSSYIIGDFLGASLFGSTTGSAGFTGQNIFLAKFSATGVFQWASRAGGAGDDHGLHLVVDRFGNSYITGSFMESARFSDIQLTSAGGSDAFMAKYDGLGIARWAVQGGGSKHDSGFAVTVDNVGTTYFTGRFQDSARIGGLKVADSGAGDFFVLKVDGAGVVQWVRTKGSAGADKGTVVAIDARDEVLVGGTYSGALRLGPSSLTHNGGGDIFFAKLGVDPGITTESISGSPFCAGNPISIPFSIVGAFNADNVFTAQLSDVAGSFATPLAIGTMNGAGGGAITGVAPPTIAPGDKYRIRVVSSSPALIGTDNGINLLFNPTPVPTITHTGSLDICDGSFVTLDAGAGFTSYQWSTGAATRTINASTPGQYTVTVANNAGCTGTSAPITVTRKTSPVKPIVLQTGKLLESSVADSYQWLMNDVEIPGATDRRYTVTENGNYRVRIANLGGCTMLSDAVNVAVTGVAREEVAGELLMYPQPTDGTFIVDMGAIPAREMLILVRDGMGREVLRMMDENVAQPYRRTIDLGTMPAGVYHIVMESGTQRWTGQIVKR